MKRKSEESKNITKTILFLVSNTRPLKWHQTNLKHFYVELDFSLESYMVSSQLFTILYSKFFWLYLLLVNCLILKILSCAENFTLLKRKSVTIFFDPLGLMIMF